MNCNVLEKKYELVGFNFESLSLVSDLKQFEDAPLKEELCCSCWQHLFKNKEFLENIGTRDQNQTAPYKMKETQLIMGDKNTRERQDYIHIELIQT